MTKTILLLALAALFAPVQDTPFNGKDLSGWKFKGGEAKNKWKVGKASLDPADPHKLVLASDGNEMVNAEGHGTDIYSEAKWGDAVIEVEVMVAKGQNSGIYVMGEYEVQVLDSFGKEKVGAGDMGGLYGAAAPKVNASKAPGEWQKYVIDYRAPKFDADGKKTSNLKFVKIELNGQILHENVELKGPTPSGVTGKEAATGPIMFQGDHGLVAYRNLKVTPVK
ncbi:MAG TPA: DUF1080 domain-containing protein [Planctomycetota bacterium]|jgi:hypothetical protein|nr:DUF1080 domain-containing protein [Planctomycetota bacterium]